MSKIEVYRIKDLESGKYLAKPSYSWNIPSLTNRGRRFSALRYVKQVAHNQRVEIYKFTHKDEFPVYNGNMSASIQIDDNWQYNPAYYEQKDKENKWMADNWRTITTWYPDSYVVVDVNDEVVVTVNELIKDMK